MPSELPQRVSRAEVLRRIAALPWGRTVLVGIDGCGAAGKSTLAAAAAARVPGAVVVHCDDFAAPHIAEWDWPRLQQQVLDPLAAGLPGCYQRWQWDRADGLDWHEVPVGRLVIIEGVSATRSELRAAWDLTVWVEAPREVRLQRALDRDGAALLPQWLADWMPGEDAYVAREDPAARVDLIVDGTVA